MPTICTYPTTDRLNSLVHHKKQNKKESESTDSWSQLSIPATTFFSGECSIFGMFFVVCRKHTNPTICGLQSDWELT